MRATQGIALATAAIAVAAAAWLAAGDLRNRSLRAHIAELSRARRQASLMAADNVRLQAALESRGGLPALRNSAAQFARFRRLFAQSELLRRNLERQLDPKTAPVWPDGASVTRPDDWAQAGQGTPAEAMERFLWEARSGNVDGLAGLITFEAGARAHAAAAFAQLPADVQSKYGSPEKVIATYIAAQIPDYAAMAPVESSNPDPTDAILDLRLEDASGDQRDFTLLLQRASDDRWRLAVPTNAVATYIGALQGRAPR